MRVCEASWDDESPLPGLAPNLDALKDNLTCGKAMALLDVQIGLFRAGDPQLL